MNCSRLSPRNISISRTAWPNFVSDSSESAVPASPRLMTARSPASFTAPAAADFGPLSASADLMFMSTKQVVPVRIISMMASIVAQ